MRVGDSKLCYFHIESVLLFLSFLEYSRNILLSLVFAKFQFFFQTDNSSLVIFDSLELFDRCLNLNRNSVFFLLLFHFIEKINFHLGFFVHFQSFFQKIVHDGFKSFWKIFVPLSVIQTHFCYQIFNFCFENCNLFCLQIEFFEELLCQNCRTLQWICHFLKILWIFEVIESLQKFSFEKNETWNLISNRSVKLILNWLELSPHLCK